MYGKCKQCLAYILRVLRKLSRTIVGSAFFEIYCDKIDLETIKYYTISNINMASMRYWRKNGKKIQLTFVCKLCKR